MDGGPLTIRLKSKKTITVVQVPILRTASDKHEVNECLIPAGKGVSGDKINECLVQAGRASEDEIDGRTTSHDVLKS